MKKHALGILIRDRWDLTEHTLNSLYYADQSKSSYDLFLIDNGSNPENIEKMKQKLSKGFLKPKNVVFINETSISKAWNLFFMMSAEYDFRTKMDNDLILQNSVTPQSEPTQPRTPAVQSTPAQADASSGSPRSVSIVKGPGNAASIRMRRQERQAARHSCFLDLMQDFGSNNGVDIVSLVAVPMGEIFMSIYTGLINARQNEMPFLIGGCMMISKKAFDTLGYFDERIERRVDIEYSQRAIRNMLNIGYHPSYGVAHIGSSNSTEPNDVAESRRRRAMSIGQSNPIESFPGTVWNKVSKKISDASKKHRFVTLKCFQTPVTIKPQRKYLSLEEANKDTDLR